jgi:hypothetical protein
MEGDREKQTVDHLSGSTRSNLKNKAVSKGIITAPSSAGWWMTPLLDKEGRYLIFNILNLSSF